MASRKRSLSNDADSHALHKEWDEASCPICMDHPHNAVLLLCSSHNKGCRSYICDTSYRHSNCLDRFKKLRADIPEGNIESSDGTCSSEARSSLRCPLCRGSVLAWEVVEEARKYLNSKSRSCSRETCSFTGSYGELRRHARRVHPSARPSDIDPSRERAWRQIEHQRDYGDIVSAIRTAMPGALVLGDYVIENGDRSSNERVRGSEQRDGPLWTTFFLFQMLGSMDQVAERRAGRSRASSTRHRRSTGAYPGRRFLWGRNLLGAQDDEEDEEEDDADVNILSDANEDASPIPRRRRRLTRYRSNEDQS